MLACAPRFASIRNLLSFSMLLALSAGPGCSGCGDDGGPGTTQGERPDAGGDNDDGDFRVDADVADPVDLPIFDEPAGDPPPELEGQACAVDTNKLYEIAQGSSIAQSATLAVNQVEAEFAILYIDRSDQCFDALKLATFSGPSGSADPEVDLALDPCASIARATIASNNLGWVIALVDDRDGPDQIFIQVMGGDNDGASYKVSDALADKTDLALAMAPRIVEGEPKTELGQSGYGAVAWVEADRAAARQSVMLQRLSVEGEPQGEPVTVEQSANEYTSLSLSRIGEDKLALGYRRFDRATRSEIVLRVFQAETGEPVRDEWVLTGDGGQQGTIAIAGDETGGGVVYAIELGLDGRQIWFQQLDATGEAAPVTSGGLSGGASEAQRVVGLPERGIDASIAKLRAGYAIAFRGLEGGRVQQPQVRVQFIDRFGRLISTPSSVALATEFGGRTTIAAGYDGRIALGWTDAFEDDTAGLTVVRLPCVGGG